MIEKRKFDQLLNGESGREARLEFAGEQREK